MSIDPNFAGGGILMLLVMLAGFAAMTFRNVSQPLAMSLVACVCLALQGRDAEQVLRAGFTHFSDIVVAFTAVAIPAHMIDRSRAFLWLLGQAGGRLGDLALVRQNSVTPSVTSLLLLVTYALAAVAHNTTAILVMTPIAIQLCSPFRIPTRFVLCGMLVASNLGGFSTGWGDTPNLIQGRVWSLDNAAFIREILPLNLCVLAVLCVIVAYLTQRHARISGTGLAGMSDEQVVVRSVGMEQYFSSYTVIDRRLLVTGLVSLGAFITLQVLFPPYQVMIGVATIAATVALERPAHRLSTLQSLGFECYIVFAAVFTLSGAVEHSWIGHTLQGMVAKANAAPWMIVLTGYLGTSSTEAASWAAAVAPAIHQLDPSHTTAWSLGAGICAGSSSLITAASAGIILATESNRFKSGDHQITFRTYLPFGIGFSVFMTVFYTVILSIVPY